MAKSRKSAGKRPARTAKRAAKSKRRAKRRSKQPAKRKAARRAKPAGLRGAIATVLDAAQEAADLRKKLGGQARFED